MAVVKAVVEVVVAGASGCSSASPWREAHNRGLIAGAGFNLVRVLVVPEPRSG